MTQPTTQIPISSIILEEDIYPRKGIDHRRVGIFAENIRDGFKFEPIEVEPAPDRPGKYRLLDGVHRWNAYKTVGVMEPEDRSQRSEVRGQRSEDETRDTARRAYNKNPALTSSDIGKAIGRARRTVDSYIADLRAATRLGIELKIFRMNSLGIPQDRIAKRLGLVRTSLHYHLSKMAKLPNSTNTDLSQGFTVSQVAEKHACPVGPGDRTGGWTEPMVWSLALEGREDIERFKKLGWGLRTWDNWEWNDCDKRFGDDWPVSSKEKPDLIIFDPPYFDKKAADYDRKSISGLPKKEYLEFLEAFFALLKQNAKKTTRLAFINAEPEAAQRFSAVVVSAMQKKRILGVTSRYVIVLKQLG
jgi:DNA-binding CsgD family transcriptional regulator